MGALRQAGLIGGLFAAVGVLTVRRGLSRYLTQLVNDPAPAGSDPGSSYEVAEPGRGSAVARVRLALGAVGVLVLLFGVWKVLHAAQPANLIWIVVWLLGSVIVHDGVLVPVVNLLRAGVHRGLPLPPAALTVLKGGFVVGGVFVLVVVPAIWAKHLGPANPTVLPDDYGRRLIGLLIVVLGLTLIGVMVVMIGRRSAANQPS